MFVFTGCSEKTVYVPEYVYVQHKIPSSITDDNIKVYKQTDMEAFVKADPILRIEMLQIWVAKLYGNIGEYKLKLKKIKQYEDNVTNTIEGYNRDKENK